MKLLIGMLTYNRLEMTKKCLESLYANTDKEDFELIIWDNGSTDGTKEWLLTDTEVHDKAKIILNEENIGVGAAINKILGYRKPEQHFMKLDNDIVFKEGTNKNWIKEINKIFSTNLVVKSSEGDKKIGSICLKPFSLDSEGNEKALLPNYMKIEFPEYNFEFNPEGTNGCSTIFRDEVLNELKKFNHYSKYGYEDCMFSVRMQLIGYLSLFNSDIARVFHIDPGGNTEYLKWKHQQAKDYFKTYEEDFNNYTQGRKQVREL